MTIEELYNNVIANDELKEKLADAVRGGTVAEWAAAQGVDASVQELLAYVKAVATEGVEIADEVLGKVAGGDEGVSTSVILAMMNIGCPPDSH